PSSRTRSPVGGAETVTRHRTSTSHAHKRHPPRYRSTVSTLVNGNPDLMRTLARKGGVKHGNRSQLSARSGAGWGFLSRILLWSVALLLWSQAYAADPQSYKVDLASTGNSDMNATLKATSDLITLRASAPVGPFGLIGRARSDL